MAACAQLTAVSGRRLVVKLEFAASEAEPKCAARAACAWWEKHGKPRSIAAVDARKKGQAKKAAAISAKIWDGFEPALAKGFGGGRPRRR